MKKTQEQLKAEFKNVLETTSTWRKSKSMIDFELKQAAYIVELHDGGLFIISKPEIKKDFCFWYSDRWQADSYEAAHDAERNARTNAEYFISENLADIDSRIEEVKEALNSENLRTRHCDNYYILKHTYNWDLEGCRLRGYELLDHFEAIAENDRLEKRWNSLELMTKEDLEARLEGLEIVKQKLVKRLQTYLKKYWLSKLHTWTYWADA